MIQAELPNNSASRRYTAQQSAMAYAGYRRQSAHGKAHQNQARDILMFRPETLRGP